MTSLQDKAINEALQGNWEDAISINKQLLKDDPDDIDTLNRLGFALEILGKNANAKSIYSKVLKLDPLNQIALRGLKKLSNGHANGQTITHTPSSLKVNNAFIEVSGKTKIVNVVNPAQASVLENLRTGEHLRLSIKRSKIFLLNSSGQFVGMLPDDLGKRLIKFINAGGLYEAYVKSVINHKLAVFLKEIKKSSRYKEHSSFV